MQVLSRPETYPHPDSAGTVEAVETHMSWVFLTRCHAYKLKKPVWREFLDFSTLEARHRNCRRELRLNRRLAPQVYLSVVPLTVNEKGTMQLGGKGLAVDWLVKMRRLPAADMLDQAIRDGTATQQRVREAAGLLATFYARSHPAKATFHAFRKRLERDIRGNLAELTQPVYSLPTDLVVAIAKAQSSFLVRRPEIFEQRVREGRIVEGHGDLRPEHIYLGSPPAIIDCLEFNRRFRILDPADELAFLALECERLGTPFVGRWFSETYTSVTGDGPPAELFSFYITLRATLRAKLAVWHLSEPHSRDPSKWPALAETYLQLARQHVRDLAR